MTSPAQPDDARTGPSEGLVELRVTWHRDWRDCPHSNEHVCPTCDFDGYYESTYPDCPWAPTEAAPDA